MKIYTTHQIPEVQVIQYLQEVLVRQVNLSMHQTTDSVLLAVLILITLFSSPTSFHQVLHQVVCLQDRGIQLAVQSEYTTQVCDDASNPLLCTQLLGCRCGKGPYNLINLET